MSGELHRLLIFWVILAGLAAAQRRQPDSAYVYRLDIASGKVQAQVLIENAHRGVTLAGQAFRGPCFDFGNITVWNSQVVFLGDRVLYPLPYRPEPPAFPFWVIDLDSKGLSAVRWMAPEQARGLRRREAERLACLRAGTRFTGQHQPDGAVAYSGGWRLNADGTLEREGRSVPGHFRQLSSGGRFPTITYEPEVAAADGVLLIQRDGQLTSLEAGWTVPLEKRLQAAWSFSQELYALLDDQLTRLDPDTGRIIWSRPLDGDDAALFRTAAGLIVVTEGQERLPESAGP